jgi:hypothetical protein
MVAESCEPVIQGTRQAALRPEAADLYPYLPARMWTSAARLSVLVAKYRGICVEASDRAHRVLSERHFRFRNWAAGSPLLGARGSG